MSLRGHVSSINGGRSEIKNLINELITEIEREHGLDNFPERYTEIDENLDFEFGTCLFQVIRTIVSTV